MTTIKISASALAAAALVATTMLAGSDSAKAAHSGVQRSTITQAHIVAAYGSPRGNASGVGGSPRQTGQTIFPPGGISTAGGTLNAAAISAGSHQYDRLSRCKRFGYCDQY